MKKTLIALAVGMAAIVSTSAMAWTEGDFNGSIDIGGDIAAPQKGVWMWQNGASQISSLNLDKSKATVDGNNFTWTGIGENSFPILMGKTSVRMPSAAGLAPVIDYGGEGFSIKQNADAPPTITLKAKGKTDSSKEGTFTFNLAIWTVASLDAPNGTKLLQGIVDSNKTFGNGYLQNAGYYRGINSQEFANNVSRILGGDMITVNGYDSSAGLTDPRIYNGTHPIVTEGNTYEGSYASEFVAKSGTITFPVSDVPDDWKVTLLTTVTYI